MATSKAILTAAALRFDLKTVKNESFIYGTYRGYNVIIELFTESNLKLTMKVSFFIKGERSADYLRDIFYIPVKFSFATDKYLCQFSAEAGGKVEKCIERLDAILNGAVQAFEQAGYVPCDSSGNEGAVICCRYKGSKVMLTEENYQAIASQVAQEKTADAEIKENVPLGLLGAIVIGLAAAAVVFFVLRMGIISSGACILLGAGVVFGYKYKGHRLSPLSALFCLAYSSVLSYFVVRLDTAFEIANVIDIDIVSAFKYVREILELAEATGDYHSNLAIAMVLCVAGSLLGAAGAFGMQQRQFELVRFN